MKKVLIIAFYFNQKEAIGSIRMRGLAKYLPNFGWDPTILTIKSKDNDSKFRVIETEYDDLYDKWKKIIGINSNKTVKEQLNIQDKKNKKLKLDLILKLWSEIFVYPDDQKYWHKYAFKSGSELLDLENFDAIISSSFPVTSHLIANDLKKKFNIPWVADLRDLWTQNPYSNHILLRKLIEKRLELKTLNEANALTTTTEYLAKDLKELHNVKEIYTIRNGFDPSKKNNGEPLTDKLSIIHAGNLYHGKRDPGILFKALNELNAEGKINIRDFSVDFYGHDKGWLKSDIIKYNLENIVKVHGTIPRGEILKKQRKSQLLLLLTWDNPNEIGIIPGKIFEYLAAKRPILSIGNPEGLVKEIIESTNSGIHTTDINQLKYLIKRYYDEYKLTKEIRCNGIENEINKYSQIEMANKFAEILNKIINWQPVQ